MIFGAILAGGKGTRMNNVDLPKQFLDLGGKPIIIHTLEKFLVNTRFDNIYIGVHEDWLLYMEDLLEKYAINKKNIILVGGGKDRNSTIMNIIENIYKNFGDNPEDIIITHDAVRPFITSRILDENIETALKYGACDTVIPAIDTIVISKNKNTIDEIPNRELMYQGQTPQSFVIRDLKINYSQLDDRKRSELTDACKIYTETNHPVYMVMGEIFNIKITTQSDYRIAKALVEEFK